MGSRARNERRGERGAVAVEFALVLIPLLLLVLGSIDFGYFLFVDQVITNAAREGARAGSVVDPAADPSVATTDAETASKEYLTRASLSSAGGGITVVADVVLVGGVDAVRVVVTYPIGVQGSMTGFFAGLMPPAARATAVMRWQ